jgi:hypothetical protein
MSEEPRQQLRIDLADLELAVEAASLDVSWYLDLETGDLVSVDAETRRELERIYEEMPDIDSGDPERFAAALEQRGLQAWEREALIDADLVETGFGERFIEVPRTTSSESYQDMEEFIATVQNGRLRDRMSSAIRGRGAFGRFRDVLAASLPEQERWFEFKRRRTQQRIAVWLEDEGIEANLDWRLK